MNSSWNSAPFFLKKLGSPKLHLYPDIWHHIKVNLTCVGEWPALSVVKYNFFVKFRQLLKNFLSELSAMMMADNSSHQRNMRSTRKKSFPWWVPSGSRIILFKDLSMMYRALWDQRHEGATRISQCTRRVAPSALTYPSGPWVPPISQCTIHHA